MRLSLLLVLALAACDQGNVQPSLLDIDNDGITSEFDCDDRDPNQHPGAEERCNGEDDNCDDVVDEGMESYVFHPDVDADGYGDPNYSKEGCSQPAGWVLNDKDCDDQSAKVHPSALDACNGVDDDCNGTPDDDPAEAPGWYLDEDKDGAGVGEAILYSCTPQEGYADNNDDCNDADAAIGPDAPDVCNGFDDNCDGKADNDVDAKPKWYDDDDGDGFGDAKGYAVSCTQPEGYVENPDDCDDTRPAAYPGAPEVCNAKDDNCDGKVDDDPANWPTWYVDLDKDGYGTTVSGSAGCKAPDSTSAKDPGDCNDADKAVHPNATEQCNTRDDDCDNVIDEAAVGAFTWYVDADGDGFGVEPDAITQCAAIDGRVVQKGDCDDADETAYPGADEICDGVDDDCDEVVDNDAIDWPRWWNDGDADGFGDPARPVDACEAPLGTVANDEDCDDSAGTTFPMATDTFGDGVDGDCDGKDCEAGFFSDAYFVACFDDLSWYEAQEWCATGYDGLALPMDQEEQDFLVDLLVAAEKDLTESPWIGLTDEAVEGTWVDLYDQAPLMTWWYEGRPDGDDNDNCAQMNSPFGAGDWNDLSCYAKGARQSYVCETRIVIP